MTHNNENGYIITAKHFQPLPPMKMNIITDAYEFSVNKDVRNIMQGVIRGVETPCSSMPSFH